MELEKEGDVTWILPKAGSMRVPVRVFASDKLLAKMKLDRTLLQASNDAALPGIIDAMNVMPDGHEGYGFPIGGVAAFDPEEGGVVSPGGVGYDINCLVEGTRILTELGFHLPIESFETLFVPTANSSGYELSLSALGPRLVTLTDKHISASRAVAFMKKQSDKRVMKITTRSGFSVTCSEDHPLRSGNTFTKTGELSKGAKLSVRFFTGVPYEKVGGDEYRKGLLARVLGYFLGDGYVSKGAKWRAGAVGEAESMKQLAEDIGQLGYSAKVVQRTRAHEIETQYGLKKFASTTSELYCTSTEFCRELVAAGMPIGRKTPAKYTVPDSIRQAPLWIKRLFLAGFFGAELSAPRTHTKTGFDAPVISQNKNITAKESGRMFLVQLMSMLEEFGIICDGISERAEHVNKLGPTVRLRLEISSDEDNLLRLWRTVGFEYNRKRSNLAEAACRYILEKQALTKRRKNLRLKAKELRMKGLTLKEAQKLLCGPEANERFIERSYYEPAGQRITLDFPAFKKYLDTALKEISNYGVLQDPIESIKEIPYSGVIYDFTVENTHNFFADGICVSNCGVRLLATNKNVDELQPNIKKLVDCLYANVPVGVGTKSKVRFNTAQLEELVASGVDFAVSEGYATKRDKEYCEENGRIAGADYSKVSQKARSRGAPQVGTLGSGNHFIEIQKIDKIYDAETAKAFGLDEEGQVTVMIHSGSRGFGHQICDDSVRLMLTNAKRNGLELPDPELSAAPLGSKEADDYFGQMNCAVNYAFNNRQFMTHFVRQSFAEALGGDWESHGLDLVYDVCHNIAKYEEHVVDGKNRNVCVHRKGATRAFWAGRKEIPLAYRSIGQPVIVPGSMNTASYVLCGLPGASASFGSSCHGAGRAMSRHAALREYDGVKLQQEMESKGMAVRAPSPKSLAEEAGGAYKDVDEVVATVAKAGISKLVARLTPLGVIKG